MAPASQVPEGTVLAAPDAESVVARLLELGDAENVLVVATDRPGLEAARAARLVLGGERLGLLHHPVPPTASFVALAALRMLPPVALGLAPALLAAVTHDSRTAALVSSVSALDKPRPTMSLDLASRLPGSVFRVDWTAQTVTRSDAIDLPVGIAAVTTASERPVRDVDAAAWGPTQIQLDTDGAFWGAKRWFEATVLLRPLEETVGALVRPDVVAAAHRCASCGRHVAGDLCVFCQIPVLSGAAPVHSGGHV
ncbi:hypothetical protein [Cellulomonas dongxiuzhuiae]|uniref:Uncharacterized protein n=1 Tax=Cellulomonas dongxiuzhuiae TaxID=2819979 RepID=A0ABX8GH03_9CELL|nr:hypothetical protein [Cellulomonas dongxiuzhuiae]MBO3088541.1 hypothetical protein [Cellulomonas dongxiuzhuiae]MBO3094126.1 hypothetical protein [Cellulomonas dongxiuzhuiae]QWC15190.1 hypothetical protein KKR89_12755 [Cellulomonas dongxiuzhuiae]